MVRTALALLLLALCAAAAQARRLQEARPPQSSAAATCPLEPGFRPDMDACKLMREVEPGCAPMQVRATAETSDYAGGAFPGALGPAGCACEAVYPGHAAACTACKVCGVVQGFPAFCDAARLRKPSPDWAYSCAVPYPGRADWMVNCGAAGPYVQSLAGGSLPRPVPQEVLAAIAGLHC